VARYYRHYSYNRKSGGATSFLGLIIALMVYLWFFNQTFFWSIFYIILFLVIIIVALVALGITSTSELKALFSNRKQDFLVRKIQELGLEEEVNNFILRFGPGKKKDKSWEFRGYSFDWERLKDFREILNEKGMNLSTEKFDDLSLILHYYIQKREENLTRESIVLTPQKFDNLTGSQFENLLYRLFSAMGATVQVTGKIGDQGGDLIMNKDGQRTVVQAKRYSGNVPNAAVQQAVAAMKFYDCNRAIVVTNSDFTREAIQLAKVNNVELLSKNELSELILKFLKESWG
jgi:restriction system protein